MLRGTIRARKPPVAYVDDEDMVQEVIVTLLRNDRAALRSMKGRSGRACGAYLKRTATSRCEDQRRKDALEQKSRCEEDPELAINSQGRPDTGTIDEALFKIRRLTWSLLSSELSSAQVQAVELKMAGYKGREIAKKLGVPENTVHSHVRRGISVLNTLASSKFPELYGHVSLTDVFIHASVLLRKYMETCWT